MTQRRVSIVLIALLACVLIGTGVSLALKSHSRLAAPTFTTVPASHTTATTASFAYRSGVHHGRFRCSLDAARARRCRSHRTYVQLTVGKHRFCVKSIRGRQRSPARCYDWTIDAVVAPPIKETGQAFTVGGIAVAPLLPGGDAVPVELTLTNPNDVPITITAITMRVTGASPAACAAVIAVAGQLAATPVLPAGSTRSLTALGIAQSAWPRLQMLDTASNQNACAQASIALEFTGSATG